MMQPRNPSRPQAIQKPVTRVRGLALDVLGEWAQGQRYAGDLLDFIQRNQDLSGPDAAFLREMVLTTLRNLSLLDHWIALLTENKHLDHRCRWALRIGLSQLLITGVSEHAAVNETVAACGRAHGLINAVLRRACREADALRDGVAALPLETRTSHPKWLVQRWTAQHGGEAAKALCEWNQQHAPLTARVNRLHPEMQNVPEEFIQCAMLPREDLAKGRVYIQDPATLIAPRLLAPQPGQRVLDACAAPGGKTAFMAELMADQGEITACDVSPGRLRRLRHNLDRLGVTCARVETHDWTSPNTPAWVQDGFDRVLLDVPCSNTGVMRRRVDVRWRLEEEDFARHAVVQRELLENGLRVLRRGGALVYSTCSIDPEENNAVVNGVLGQLGGFCLEKEESSMPPGSGMDGAYAARIVRE